MTARKARLMKVYGITPDDFTNMLKLQGGVCAICLQPETDIYPNGMLKQLAVDHDHETGKVRGLLCRSCNQAIGMLKEDPQVLLSAVRYLEAHVGGA